MPGLDPGIHAVARQKVEGPLEWIAGSSPAMTVLLESSRAEDQRHIDDEQEQVHDALQHIGAHAAEG